MQTSIRQSYIRNVCTVALFVQVSLTATWGATTYYVSPTGSDSNLGTTINAPFQTIQWAASKVLPGDTVIVRDGVYSTNPYVPDPSIWALVVIKWGGSSTAWVT